ncbi:MAG: biotin transporter BioY [Ruminococcus sp.]|jgi:biotin transport system substrate-specific component|nr:biotin transporter BioY [Ruminococcus sp.]
MQQTKIKHLTLAALFTAIIVVCAQIIIPIPPIEFTMQVFGVLLAAAMLPPFYATLSVTAYVLLGAFGLPVFKHFTGGFQSVVGPTGGYIIAFIFMAMATSLAVKYLPKHVGVTVGMVVALVICHLFGTAWFALSMDKSFKESFLLCSAPFILPDICKAVCAGLLSAKLPTPTPTRD